MLLLKRTKTAFPLKYFIIGLLLVPASPSLPPFLVSYPEQSPACPQTLQFLLFILGTLSSPPNFMGQFFVTTQGQSTFLWKTLPRKRALFPHTWPFLAWCPPQLGTTVEPCGLNIYLWPLGLGFPQRQGFSYSAPWYVLILFIEWRLHSQDQSGWNRKSRLKSCVCWTQTNKQEVQKPLAGEISLFRK